MIARTDFWPYFYFYSYFSIFLVWSVILGSDKENKKIYIIKNNKQTLSNKKPSTPQQSPINKTPSVEMHHYIICFLKCCQILCAIKDRTVEIACTSQRWIWCYDRRPLIQVTDLGRYTHGRQTTGSLHGHISTATQHQGKVHTWTEIDTYETWGVVVSDGFSVTVGL